MLYYCCFLVLYFVRTGPFIVPIRRYYRAVQPGVLWYGGPLVPCFCFCFLLFTKLVNILTEKQAEETTEQEANVKTAGIIAEYNPFHNGHQYQMETVRHLTGADFVIVAMSGRDFHGIHQRILDALQTPDE